MIAQHPAPPATDREQDGELRDFMLVVREALLFVVKYIERRYGKSQSPR